MDDLYHRPILQRAVMFRTAPATPLVKGARRPVNGVGRLDAPCANEYSFWERRMIWLASISDQVPWLRQILWSRDLHCPQGQLVSRRCKSRRPAADGSSHTPGKPKFHGDRLQGGEVVRVAALARHAKPAHSAFHHAGDGGDRLPSHSDLPAEMVHGVPAYSPNAIGAPSMRFDQSRGPMSAMISRVMGDFRHGGGAMGREQIVLAHEGENAPAICDGHFSDVSDRRRRRSLFRADAVALDLHRANRSMAASIVHQLRLAIPEIAGFGPPTLCRRPARGVLGRIVTWAS